MLKATIPLAQSLKKIVRRVERKQAYGLLFALLALPVTAAPLDAFLTAQPEQVAPNGYLEAGVDKMNEQLDFFKIRDSNTLASGTQAGDYQGAHLNGAWRVKEGMWITGSLMQRNLNGLADTFHFNSWRASGLYKFKEADGKIPAMAVRLSAWGNYADEIGSSSRVAVPGAILNTVKLTNPSDRQLQADLIGTWQLTPATDMSLFMGVGNTQLSYGDLSGTATLNGCNYQLSFIGNTVEGKTSSPCSTGADWFSVPSSKYGVDVAKELGWRGNFVQFGANAAWRSGPWTLRGGYLFYAVQREAVDDILASRGWTVYNQSQNLLLEANYRFHPHLTAYARSQLSSTMFFNEMPVTYNTFSSDLFGTRYSLFTVGLRADF